MKAGRKKKNNKKKTVKPCGHVGWKFLLSLVVTFSCPMKQHFHFNKKINFLSLKASWSLQDPYVKRPMQVCLRAPAGLGPAKIDLASYYNFTGWHFPDFW